MMSIFNFFSNLFSRKNDFQNASDLQTFQPSADYNPDAWEKEQLSRINELELKIKDRFVDLIRSKNNHLKFSWDSGNDEAFLNFEGHENTFDNEEFWELEEYLILKLDIPDAGEFEMHGEGFLTIENHTIVADFWSTLRFMEDYDEEKEEEIWSEAETEKKVEKLFQI
ncbi:hypothetical protein OMO38_13990 [Chryseobacterium sp. 09-1422]|uniref:DUF4240 domain-containing protein n=2 Tax=Chryseobacterium kimseyorum TaxID=2984028 RepID=A0ABT3I0R1_9FLAO|nr:hypothetical protein [Chryseobacterium kimseyorum]